MPFSTQMAGFFNSHGQNGPVDYSAVGYYHYLPGTLVVSWLTGYFETGSLFSLSRNLTNKQLFPVIRLQNAIIGALTIFLFVWLLRFYEQPWMILLMGFLIAISPSMIYWSHTESIQTPTFFWGVMCAVFLTRYLYAPSLKWMILMAACGTMAALVKESFWGVAPVLILAGPLYVNGIIPTFKSSTHFKKYIVQVIAGTATCFVLLVVLFGINPEFNKRHLDDYLYGENTNLDTASDVLTKQTGLHIKAIPVGMMKNIALGLSFTKNNMGPALFFAACLGALLILLGKSSSNAAVACFLTGVAYLVTYISWVPFFWRRILDYDLAFPAILFTPVAAITLERILSRRRIKYGGAAIILATLLLGWIFFKGILTSAAFEFDNRHRLESFLEKKTGQVEISSFNNSSFKINFSRSPDKIIHYIYPPKVETVNWAREPYVILSRDQHKAYKALFSINDPQRRYQLADFFTTPWYFKMIPTADKTSVYLYRLRPGKADLPLLNPPTIPVAVVEP